MRVAAAGAAFALLLTACTSSSPVASEPREATVTPVPTPTAVPAPTATPTAVPTSTPVPTPTPTPEPKGLITDTGVPVQILASLLESTIVMTPCGRVAEITGGEPLHGIRVVLDPGHGGPIDTGAVGPNGLVERDLNLDLSFATQAELEARGITVALTRTFDYATILATRAAFADALEVEALVSIHHNAPNAFASDVPGTEIFVQSDSPDSRRLGEVLYETVFDALATIEGIAWTTAGDAGVVRVLNTEGGDAYGMIRRPSTPTALIELGYLSNASEAELFATPEYIELAAIALADGIEAYLDTDEPGRGWVEEPRVFNPNRAPGQDVCVDPPLDADDLAELEAAEG